MFSLKLESSMVLHRLMHSGLSSKKAEKGEKKHTEEMKAEKDLNG